MIRAVLIVAVAVAAGPVLANAASRPAANSGSVAGVPPPSSTLAPPAAAGPLAPADIKTMFGTGKPFTAVSSPGGKTFTFTLKPDGSAVQTPKGSNTTATTGTWRVNDKGYCSKWGTNSEHCYVIVKNGKAYDVKDASNHVVSHWTPPA